MPNRFLPKLNLPVVILVAVATVLLLTGSGVLAHTGGMYGGTWASPTQLKAQVFVSAYSYWDFASHGSFAWNYSTSSSKLWMKEIAYDATDKDAGAQIKIRGVALGADGAYADAQNYTKVWWGYKACYNGDSDLCGNVTYAYSVIRINTDNFGSVGTDMNRRTAMTHEVGHSLALKHPDHATDTAIMVQGEWDFDVPKEHDIAVIKAKYGE